MSNSDEQPTQRKLKVGRTKSLIHGNKDKDDKPLEQVGRSAPVDILVQAQQKESDNSDSVQPLRIKAPNPFKPRSIGSLRDLQISPLDDNTSSAGSAASTLKKTPNTTALSNNEPVVSCPLGINHYSSQLILKKAVNEITTVSSALSIANVSRPVSSNFRGGHAMNQTGLIQFSPLGNTTAGFRSSSHDATAAARASFESSSGSFYATPNQPNNPFLRSNPRITPVESILDPNNHLNSRFATATNDTHESSRIVPVNTLVTPPPRLPRPTSSYLKIANDNEEQLDQYNASLNNQENATLVSSASNVGPYLHDLEPSESNKDGSITATQAKVSKLQRVSVPLPSSTRVRTFESERREKMEELHSRLIKKHRRCHKIMSITIIFLLLVCVAVPFLALHFKNGNAAPQSDFTYEEEKAASHGGSSHHTSILEPSATGSIGSGMATKTPTSTPAPVAVPENYRDTLYDVATWKYTDGFNLTFTDTCVGGLPIIGLNSTWNDDAQANSLVPPLNRPFSYGKLPIRGVNLGGWLLLEPFITPSFFEKYDASMGVVDEWTLMHHLKSTEEHEAASQLLENHYATFVTEDTFKEIREAGLDHVRIPIGFWAVRTWKEDKFLPQVSWRYLLRGIEWARKYGIRVNLDLHSVPGGQNGWNHSGRQGVLKWMNGKTGFLNGEKALEIHTSLATFFAQDRYKNVVTMYGLVNEPNMMSLDTRNVNQWTEIAYHLVRDKGYEGVISFGDGFLGVDSWQGVFEQSEFPIMALDVHEYTIFDMGLIQMSHAQKIAYVCSSWSDQMKRSSDSDIGHGPTFVGEWSQADNDCTLYLNDVGAGTRWEGTLHGGVQACHGNHNCTCSESNQDPSLYSPAYKKFLLDFAEAQMQVFESEGAWGSFYWAWDTEQIESSQWSYKKGRDAGILPWVAYERSFSCSDPLPDYRAMGLPETY